VLGGDEGPATEVRSQVGEVAGAEQVVVLGLAPRARSLEAAFFALTAGAS